MPHGVPCSCKPKDRSKWRVTKFMHNRSAFNGYKRTPSEFSEVRCTVCKGRWRTKARYVTGLYVALPGEF